RKYKNDSMEGGITSPFIVSWPGRINTPGGLVRQPSHLIDIMATLCDIGQSDYPASWKGKPITPSQGVSLRPLLEGQPFTRSEPIYWQWRKGRAIRKNQWKLVSHGGPWELYDIAKDRTEMRDVSHLQAGVTRHLADLWEKWAEEVGLRER
ncbi:MAG: sulfatase/phosphatase domain-containing protein, partial [Verrucomicrobiales bacterium]